jgi:hypothetical protein
MKRLLGGHQSALQLSYPFGQTLVLALLMLALLVGSLEAVSRLSVVAAHLPAPSTGGSRTDFDIKLNILDAQQRTHHPVDCLFMGSSILQYGADPRVFERAYLARTGQTLHCFNFSLSALTPSDVPVLAEFLIERYHPRLLVYGLSVREFSTRIEIRHKNDSVVSEWMKYRQGEFSLQGWLIDQVQAYRFYLALDNWMTPDFSAQLEDDRQTEQKETTYGGYRPREHIFVVPDDLQQLRARQSLGQEIGPEALTRFEELVRLQARFPDTALILVEVPVNPVLYVALFDERTYHDLIGSVEATTQSQGVIFLRDTNFPPLPAEAWYDEVHLNTTGAEIFSTWLGDQIGIAVNEKRLPQLAH